MVFKIKRRPAATSLAARRRPDGDVFTGFTLEFSLVEVGKVIIARYMYLIHAQVHGMTLRWSQIGKNFNIKNNLKYFYISCKLQVDI